MNTYDFHTHTIAGGHGTHASITDMAKSAAKKGLRFLGISDHGPATFGSATASYFMSLSHAPRERFGVRIFYGVELNILDYEGHVDLNDSVLKELDYAIISLHTQNIAPGNASENTRAYIRAMRHPKVKIIGHCDDPRYPVNYMELAEAAKEYNIFFELNEASLYPGSYRGDCIGNNISMFMAAEKYRVPILLSSDSHGPNGIGETPACLALISAYRNCSL